MWRRPSGKPRVRSFFFQAEDGIRDLIVTGVQTCALPISELPSGRLLTSPTASTPGSLRARSTSWSKRSEEHTSELQSRSDLVCRLLLEKKKKTTEKDSSHYE